MQRHEPQSVGDVLRDLLEESELQNRMEELKAADLWPKVAGKQIASLTSRPLVKKGVMQIGVPIASLRQELHMNRSRLKEFINQAIGKEIIKELKFTS